MSPIPLTALPRIFDSPPHPMPGYHPTSCQPACLTTAACKAAPVPHLRSAPHCVPLPDQALLCPEVVPPPPASETMLGPPLPAVHAPPFSERGLLGVHPASSMPPTLKPSGAFDPPNLDAWNSNAVSRGAAPPGRGQGASSSTASPMGGCNSLGFRVSLPDAMCTSAGWSADLLTPGLGDLDCFDSAAMMAIPEPLGRPSFPASAAVLFGFGVGSFPDTS